MHSTRPQGDFVRASPESEVVRHFCGILGLSLIRQAAPGSRVSIADLTCRQRDGTTAWHKAMVRFTTLIPLERRCAVRLGEPNRVDQLVGLPAIEVVPS